MSSKISFECFILLFYLVELSCEMEQLIFEDTVFIDDRTYLIPEILDVYFLCLFFSVNSISLPLKDIQMILVFLIFCG